MSTQSPCRDPNSGASSTFCPFVFGSGPQVHGLVGGNMAMTTSRTADVYSSLTPYIAVVDASRAIDWYQEVFAAERRGDFVVDPDGQIGHAELAIGDAVLMLSEDRAGDPWTDSSWRCSLFVRVPDADTTVGK